MRSEDGGTIAYNDAVTYFIKPAENLFSEVTGKEVKVESSKTLKSVINQQ